MKTFGKTVAIILAAVSAAGCCATQTQESQNDKFMEEKLNLTQEWDKVFPQSNKVSHSKVTFHNRYGVTLAADLYVPENASGKLPAAECLRRTSTPKTSALQWTIWRQGRTSTRNA